MGNLQHWVILPLVVITLVALPCVHAAPFGTDSALRYQPLEAKTSNQLDRTSQFTEPNDNSHGRKPDLDRDLYHYSDRLRELIKRFEKTRQKAYWSGNHGYGNDFVIVDKVECYVCKGVTWVLQQTLHHNEAKFAEIADDLCTKLQIEPPDICHGIVALFKVSLVTMVTITELFKVYVWLLWPPIYATVHNMHFTMVTNYLMFLVAVGIII